MWCAQRDIWVGLWGLGRKAKGVPPERSWTCCGDGRKRRLRQSPGTLWNSQRRKEGHGGGVGWRRWGGVARSQIALGLSFFFFYTLITDWSMSICSWLPLSTFPRRDGAKEGFGRWRVKKGSPLCAAHAWAGGIQRLETDQRGTEESPFPDGDLESSLPWEGCLRNIDRGPAN